MFFNQYPYLNVSDLNLDYLLTTYTKIIADLKQIENYITRHDVDYKEVLKRLDGVDNEIVDLDAKIDREINDLSSEMTALYNNVVVKVSSELALMHIQINSIEGRLREMINAEHYVMEHYVNARIAAFIESLPDYNDLIVYNPVRGYNTIVQDAINDLYNYFNAYGLTAEQYDSLELTAQEYDSEGLSAADYDSRGYILLNYPDPRWNMRNPFNGLLEPISNVVNMLFRLHYAGMSAQDYDNRELTTDEYDNLLLNAFDYDAYGIV